MRLIERERRGVRVKCEFTVYINRGGGRKTKEVMMEERERREDGEKEMWRGRGEAQQILSGGEIALLRIYCFKCNWVQPAPGERNPLKSPLLRGGEPVHSTAPLLKARTMPRTRENHTV